MVLRRTAIASFRFLVLVLCLQSRSEVNARPTTDSTPPGDASKAGFFDSFNGRGIPDTARWIAENSCSGKDLEEYGFSHVIEEDVFVRDDNLHMSIPDCSSHENGSKPSSFITSTTTFDLLAVNLTWRAKIPAEAAVTFELYDKFSSLSFHVNGEAPSVIKIKTHFLLPADSVGDSISGSTVPADLVDDFHDYQVYWLDEKRTMAFALDGADVIDVNVSPELLALNATRAMHFRIKIEDVLEDTYAVQGRANGAPMPILQPAAIYTDSRERDDLLVEFVSVRWASEAELRMVEAMAPASRPKEDSASWPMTMAFIAAFVVIFFVGGYTGMAQRSRGNRKNSGGDDSRQLPAEGPASTDQRIGEICIPMLDFGKTAGHDCNGRLHHNEGDFRASLNVHVLRPRPMLLPFLLKMLDRPHNGEQELICWMDYDQRIFKFLQPEAVARKWGEQKGSPRMTYAKMSRVLRKKFENQTVRKVKGTFQYQILDARLPRHNAQRVPKSIGQSRIQFPLTDHPIQQFNQLQSPVQPTHRSFGSSHRHTTSTSCNTSHLPPLANSLGTVSPNHNPIQWRSNEPMMTNSFVTSTQILPEQPGDGGRWQTEVPYSQQVFQQHPILMGQSYVHSQVLFGFSLNSSPPIDFSRYFSGGSKVEYQQLTTAPPSALDTSQYSANQISPIPPRVNGYFQQGNSDGSNSSSHVIPNWFESNLSEDSSEFLWSTVASPDSASAGSITGDEVEKILEEVLQEGRTLNRRPGSHVDVMTMPSSGDAKHVVQLSIPMDRLPAVYEAIRQLQHSVGTDMVLREVPPNVVFNGCGDSPQSSGYESCY